MTSHRIVRIHAYLMAPKFGQEWCIASHDFDMKVPEGKALTDYWSATEGSGTFEDCIGQERNGEATLRLYAPSDLQDQKPSTYLRTRVAEHSVEAGGFHLLTSIVKTYGDLGSPYNSDHERLVNASVYELDELAQDAKSLRKRVVVGEVSEDLWEEAVDALFALRVQAGLEMGDCENLTEVFENSLTTEFMNGLFGGGDSLAEIAKRTKAAETNLARKQLAVIKLERQLYKLVGKKVNPALLDGATAYH